MTQRERTFLQELKALLKRYGASIDFTCESGGFALIGEAMEIDILDEESQEHKTILVAPGCSLDESCIQDD